MADELKSQLFAAYKDKIRKIYPIHTTCKISFKQGRYTVYQNDGSELYIALNTVSKCSKVGAFDVYSSFGINNGKIFNIMTETGLVQHVNFPDNGIVRGILHNFRQDVPFHLVDEKTDFEKISDDICREIEELYVPIIVAFTTDYRVGVDIIFSYYNSAMLKIKVRNPFTTAIIFMGLTNDYSRLKEVVSAAYTYNTYIDFTSDYSDKIIKPIQQWFKNNR